MVKGWAGFDNRSIYFWRLPRRPEPGRFGGVLASAADMNAPRLFLLSLAALALAGCQSSTAPAAPSPTPTPKPPPNLSKPTRQALHEKLDDAKAVYHVGCHDEEKASCKDPTRICGGGVEGEMKSALKKGEIIVEWEAPRETWAKNEGVLDHYWMVKPDGSGTYFYLLPSPDDIQTDCGNGEYCGWHKEEFAAGTLFAGGKFHFTPHKGTEIADLKFCPPPPPQP